MSKRDIVLLTHKFFADIESYNSDVSFAEPENRDIWELLMLSWFEEGVSSSKGAGFLFFAYNFSICNPPVFFLLLNIIA